MRTYALLREQGLAVRQIATYETAMPARLLIDCNEGLTPARDNALRALGQGVPVVTSNALLPAVHGRVLHNAASGQHTTFNATAALGLAAPLMAWLPQAQVSRILMAMPMGANAIMQRMLQRDEDAHRAQLALEHQGEDTCDATGKQSYARSLALYASLTGDWQGSPATSRNGPEILTKTLLAHMRRFGLAPVFAADIIAGQVHVGLMATAPESPIMQGLTRETMVVHTPAGEQMFSRQVVGHEATARQLVAEAAHVLTQPISRTHVGQFAVAETSQYLLMGEYVHRHRLLEMGATVVDEQLTGTGDWLAIVAAASAPQSSHWSLVPLAGTYQPDAVKLRLVG